MKHVVTFGEVMMRLATPAHERFIQTRRFDVTFAGGEANVAASLAQFGLPTQFVTRLPDNDLGDACLNFLRQYGIGVDYVARGGDRLGVYFLETGAVQRPSKVIYDRAQSAIAAIPPGTIPWNDVFSGAQWFHWTGITPAISEAAARECLTAAAAARELGLTVSCDLNFRAKLWKWGKQAGEVMTELVSLCDVAVGNEEDAEKVFGIKAAGADVTGGKVDAASYRQVCETLVERFPNLKTVAITLRGSLSASHNTWSGVLYHHGAFYDGPAFDIVPIVDRVGGGDSFCGGLIYGLLVYGDPQKAIDFAVAASCLKHTIHGDFNLVRVAEVEKLMGGDASGRVSR
ncbi:MAG: sugar kinase [Candidatus Hydrogenedentes bacterium]|nr:sugar kinase [Candidatus Hydrogenedentota bacterium]